MATSSSSLPSLSISGITLASLLHLASTSPCDASGLLSGHLTVPSLPPPLSDYDDTSASISVTPPSLLITNLYSFPSPIVDPSSLLSSLAPSISSPIIGWFSFRRNTSLRPSIREQAVSSSISQTLDQDTPCIFLLLSSSLSPNRAVHTHLYKAYVFKQGEKPMLQPVSLNVINVGPSSSGGQYGNFSPEISALPLMPCGTRGTEDGHFMKSCSEGEKKKMKKEESLGALKEKMHEQKILDSVTENFEVQRLERLVSGPSNNYTNELEELYCSMLSKLENLKGLVEKSSAKLSEQENRNLELRCKLAGME